MAVLDALLSNLSGETQGKQVWLVIDDDWDSNL